MKTRGDAMTSDAETVLARIKTLGSSSFSRPDLAELIEPFTSRLEYFLKAVVFPSASRRTKLHQLIEDLLGLGLSAQDVSALHRLRELYNKSKHDPGNDAFVPIDAIAGQFNEWPLSGSPSGDLNV